MHQAPRMQSKHQIFQPPPPQYVPCLRITVPSSHPYPALISESRDRSVDVSRRWVSAVYQSCNVVSRRLNPRPRDRFLVVATVQGRPGVKSVDACGPKTRIIVPIITLKDATIEVASGRRVARGFANILTAILESTLNLQYCQHCDRPVPAFEITSY